MSSSDSTAPPPGGTIAAGRQRPWWKRALEVSFYVGLVTFATLYLRSLDLDQLRGLSPRWWALAVATALSLGFRYWGAFIWTVLLRKLGARNVRLDAELVHVYARSWLGRYIPGTAPWILGKIWFASEHGVDRGKLAISSLLEAGLQIVVQLVFAFALLAFDPRLDVLSDSARSLLIVAMVLCVVALVPVVFNAVVGLALRVLRRKPLSQADRVTWPTVATGFGLYLVGALAGGSVLFFLAVAVEPELGVAEAPFVLGAASLAGAASLLAVFVPGGLGVREGIQVALLRLIMPTEVAVVVAVLARLHGVAIDALFFAMAHLHRSVGRRRTGSLPG